MVYMLGTHIAIFQSSQYQRDNVPARIVALDEWEIFWSFPDSKKRGAEQPRLTLSALTGRRQGRSKALGGLTVYTRKAKCTPIRVEEGFTGSLTMLDTSTECRAQPEDLQIGGYSDTKDLSMQPLARTSTDISQGLMPRRTGRLLATPIDTTARGEAKERRRRTGTQEGKGTRARSQN
jgi:hypothetical protein